MDDGRRSQIQWVQEIGNHYEIVGEEVITIDAQAEEEEGQTQQYLVHGISTIPTTLDHIAAENLIYMAQDAPVADMEGLIQETVESNDTESYDEKQYFECQVTEEVITDDWVQPQGEERVEIAADQLGGSRGIDSQLVEELDVPLPTDQDEYTVLRPYPCDFCSRRFRKKVSLMNHMIAHQNDRPHVCNLCGARYGRRSDLLHHLEMHAHLAESKIGDIDDNYYNDNIDTQPSHTNDYYDHDVYEEKPHVKFHNRSRKLKIKEENKYSDHERILNEVIEEQIPDKFPITDPKRPFVCQQCGVSFAREKAMISHTKIHGNDSPYECVNCSEMFWDLNSLQEHQRTHHFDASNSEYEPENDEETGSENDLKYEENYCNICGMCFHRKDLLKRHSKIHVKRETTDRDSRHHCCNVCGETFAEALDLLAHAEVHARCQPFRCVLCGETFLEEATIKKHLTNVHSSEMNANSCRLCGKQCRDGRALMKHAWDHSREKNNSCTKCGKTFHNKARLKRHMVSHRNKSVICNVCHEEFPDGRSLMNHRHSHSNTSGRLFPCHECGKTFGSRSSQQIHIRIHTGERPYGCRFCWKAFADGGTLRKHERIHTGEKPYACSVCPRAFNQRVVLREHIRSHHSGLDSKRGTYFCTVCSEVLPSSIELTHHLIQHSDMNTAMQRQPITGPRKYKRRRKLKPHELERLRAQKSNNSDMEYSDLEVGHVDILSLSTKESRNRAIDSSTSSVNATITERNRNCSESSDKFSNSWPNKLVSTAGEDGYNSVFQNLENALQNIDSLVVDNTTTNTFSSPVQKSKSSGKKKGSKNDMEKPSRPKMIHTQKTRIAAEDGKRKTKTLITRTQPAEIDDQIFHQFDRIKDTSQIPCNQEVIIKEENVTRNDLFDAQLLLEAASIRKEMDKYNPDVVNDLEEILRSPIKSKPVYSHMAQSNSTNQSHNPEEELRRSARIRRSAPNRKYLELETPLKQSKSSNYDVKIKQEKSDKIEIKIEKNEEEVDMKCISNKGKSQYFQCEMCSAVFTERTQLLDHVPIHI